MDNQQRAGHNNQQNNQNQTNRRAPNTNMNTRSNVPVATVRAYEMAELYRQKKERKLQKIRDEEERLRRHKARPMPNFNAIHAVLTTVQHPVETCISPETPEVLKRGLAMKEKQKQKIKEYEAKLMSRPPIVARSSKVLTEEPFKPKLEPHAELKVVPFNLGMEKRLMERKEYDQNYQRQLAEKKEQEEKQKRERENLIRQAARERTTFKARPNPFK